MDPFITKLLEEDEDENMHSGVEVEAFTAALNRDIVGDSPSISQPSDRPHTEGVLPQECSSTSDQLTGQWQTTSHEKHLAQKIQQQEEQRHLQAQERCSSQVEQIKLCVENQHQQIGCQSVHDDMMLQQEKPHADQQQRQKESNAHQLVERNQVQISEQNPVHHPEQDRPQHPESQQQHLTQRLNNQQAPTSYQANNQTKLGFSIPFHLLIPILNSHLDKDRSMQLQTLFSKLRSNEINKVDFLRVTRNIVGDQMLRHAAHKVQMQMWSKIPSATPPVAAVASTRTPLKKPSVGQKKPLETLGTHSTPASKKQKVSGPYHDQSIELLNDVTAFSGVNLREEEEQLLSVPKEESRASEATRKVVQEEEERLILQKGPLQKKLVEIMSKCGIMNIGSDVELCLSMCVEERLQGLMTNLIRLSKQRVDIEKARHRIVFTSDVRCQILAMNRKAKEEWEKKQAEETEKLRKLNESEGNTVADADKDEGRSMAVKSNKDDDDKMQATAANVAARAAVGGEDMLLKWQLMAEHARQTREAGLGAASGSLPCRATSHKSLSNFVRTSRDNQEADQEGPSAASATGDIGKFGRSPVMFSHPKVVCNISTKDVIAVLEREPQMSKSALIHSLYERISSNFTAEF